MKRFLIITILSILIFLPVSIKAEVLGTNLKDALAEENITPSVNFNTYKETDDQVTIYLFRGRECGYCRKFLTFLNNIIGDYGQYFKVRSYEVWYNEDNEKLLKGISNYLNHPAEGVPYIIIGEKVYNGYSEEWDNEIKGLIVSLYKTDVKDRYDVMKKYQPEETPKEEVPKNDEELNKYKTDNEELRKDNDKLKDENKSLSSTTKKAKTTTLVLAIGAGVLFLALVVTIIIFSVKLNKTKKSQ